MDRKTWQRIATPTQNHASRSNQSLKITNSEIDLRSGNAPLPVVNPYNLPPFAAAAAMGPLKARLVNGQDAIIVGMTDSTGHSDYSPLAIIHRKVAESVSGTARLVKWAEWDDGLGTATGPKSYKAPVDTVYGDGPIVTLYLCSLPGSVSAFPWDASRKAAALDALPTPHLVIHHTGHNMSSFDTQSALALIGDNLVTGRGLILATVGMTSLQWPGVAQVITTQNPDRKDAAMTKMINSIKGVATALPSLSLVDTAEDFDAMDRAEILYRMAASDLNGIHPSDYPESFRGAALQADRMWAAYELATPGAYSTVDWTHSGGPNLLTNGDMTDWTGALPTNWVSILSQTGVKDASVTYAGAPYSMRCDGLNGNAAIRYQITTAERNALLNKTVSLAILFKTTSKWSGGDTPFFANFQVQNSNQNPNGSNSLGWVQGGNIMKAQGEWYLAVFPGVQCGPAMTANTSITIYPSFARTPTSGSMWIQRAKLVEGSLPSLF